MSNIVTFPEFVNLITSDFMIRAIIAGIFVAICAGVLGYFVLIRRYTFASHALAHIGIPGATGAILLGISPVFGLLGFCIIGAILISLLGSKVDEREIATGSVLAFATGLGLYFSSLSSRASKTLQSVLFGNILGVDDKTLFLFGIFTLVIVGILLMIYRPLLFLSISPEVATSKGVRTKLLNTVFVVLLSFSTVMSIQVVGSLLLFALLITPAATALKLTANPILITVLSVIFAIGSTIFGIVFGLLFNIPISFAIVTCSTCLWLLSKLKK